MADKNPIILPEKYYLDYFNYLLGFVEKHYQHVLDAPEYLFYQSFRNLSEDAQCLYLRFSNRRGDFFRMNKVVYSEITNVNAAKEELVLHEFIGINESTDALQFKLFTKKELLAQFDFLDSSLKKDEVLELLTEQDLAVIHQNEEIAQVKKNDEVSFLKLLFFGNRYTQMTEFVIRDIGNIRLERLDETKFKPWFESREEAISVMHISQLRKMIKEIIAEELPLEEYLEEMPWQAWLSYPKSQKSAEKLLLNLGEYFEKSKNWDEAINYYSLTSRHPSRERRIRIYEKIGSSIEGQELANEIISSPSNASELTFALDYLNRSGVRINRSMTERLKTAPKITLDRNDQLNVEALALSHFEADGWYGVHAENYLWRGLFGLVFWHEIFDEQHGSFHHPLQRQPSDLHDSSFFENRERNLKKRLAGFKRSSTLLKHVRSIHEEKFGIANRFVTWHETLLPLAETMIEKVPLKSLKKVLMEMSLNMRDNSKGFPDLFIWSENDYQFYEIKSPNDQLSAQQLFWLNFFNSVGIKAEVLRVYYSD